MAAAHLGSCLLDYVKSLGRSEQATAAISHCMRCEMTPANTPNLRLRMTLLDLQPSVAGFEVMLIVPARIDPHLLTLI